MLIVSCITDRYRVYRVYREYRAYLLITTRVFIRQQFIRKWDSNGQNLKKILRKSQGWVSKFKCFCWPKIDIASLLHSKCWRWNWISSMLYKQRKCNFFSQFISVKVTKYFKKISGSVLRKVKKLRLRQNDGFLIRKYVVIKIYLLDSFLASLF